MASIKFFKGQDWSSYEAGGVYFDNASHQILVGKNDGSADSYGSDIADVTFAEGKLTVSFYGGKDSVVVDLSKCASAEAVATELVKVGARVTALENAIGAEAKDAVPYASYEEYAAAMVAADVEPVAEEVYNENPSAYVKEAATPASGILGDVAGVKDRIDALETAIGDSDTSLSSRIDDLEAAIGDTSDSTQSLSERVDDLSELVGAPSKPASGEEGSDDYVPASDASGIFADVEDLDSRVAALENKEEIEIPVTGVADGDQVLSLIDGKVSSSLSMSYVDGEDGKKYIKLYGKTMPESEDKYELGSVDCSDFLVDGMLKGVEKVTISEEDATDELPAGDYFKFDFDGDDKDIFVPLSDFAISSYTAGSDLKLDGDEFSVSLSEDITIAGGPLANNVAEVGDEWPWQNSDGANIIPEGLSLSEILTGLFLKVKNGTVSAPVYSWNPTLGKATISKPTAGTYEVGTVLDVEYSANNSVTGNTATVSVAASDGYFTATDGTWNAGSYSESVTGSKSGSASASATYNGSSVDSGSTITVEAGQKSLSVSNSGVTASVADFAEASVYASTNTKKVLSDSSVDVEVNHFAADRSLTAANATCSITGARACWYGFTNDAAVADDLTNAYFRGITATSVTGNGVKKSLTMLKTGSEITAKAGFKGLVIAIPSDKEIKTLIAKGATTDLMPSAEVMTVSINGANDYAAAEYNVYYWAWAEGGDDSTYVVTLK